MKTAIRRIFILRLARRTHGETGHGRVYPVVGDIFDNGQPRAAICAIDEGITESSIFEVKKFFIAFTARSDIRRNIHFSQSAGFTLNYPEYLIVLDFYFFAGKMRNIGKRRELFIYCGYEEQNGFFRAFHLRNDPIRAVLNETRQRMSCCYSIDEWTKSYALDNAGEMVAYPFCCVVFYRSYPLIITYKYTFAEEKRGLYESRWYL
jgi:hypothetical protein